MNERIKELISEAGFGLGSFGFDSDPEMACGSVKDLEKLAELIVKECVQVIKDCEKYGHSLPLEFEVTNYFGVE